MVAMLLLWAATGTPSHAGKYRLPQDAKITIGKVQADEGAPTEDKNQCPAFTLTEREVRKMFRTYRLYIPARDYESYSDSPCHIEGTIVYRGKTYTFDAEDTEKMRSTTWPDGKVKALAGKPWNPKDFE